MQAGQASGGLRRASACVHCNVATISFFGSTGDKVLFYSPAGPVGQVGLGFVAHGVCRLAQRALLGFRVNAKRLCSRPHTTPPVVLQCVSPRHRAFADCSRAAQLEGCQNTVVIVPRVTAGRSPAHTLIARQRSQRGSCLHSTCTSGLVQSLGSSVWQREGG